MSLITELYFIMFYISSIEDLGSTTRYVHVLVKITFSRNKIGTKTESIGATIRYVQTSFYYFLKLLLKVKHYL